MMGGGGGPAGETLGGHETLLMAALSCCLACTSTAPEGDGAKTGPEQNVEDDEARVVQLVRERFNPDTDWERLDRVLEELHRAVVKLMRRAPTDPREFGRAYAETRDEILRRHDRALWEEVQRNLARVKREATEERMQRVAESLSEYRRRTGWFPNPRRSLTALFTAPDHGQVEDSRRIANLGRTSRQTGSPPGYDLMQLSEQTLFDAWDRELEFRVREGRGFVISAGADGELGTADDIIVEVGQ